MPEARTHRRIGPVLVAALALAALAGGSAWTLWRQFGAANPTNPPASPPANTITPSDPARGTANAATGRASDSASAALHDARLALDSGDNSAARAILERAVQRWPQDRELRLRLSEALVAAKDFAAAYEHSKAAINLSAAAPAAETAALHFDAGTIANAAGLSDEALSHYLLAQKADPANPRIALYLGMVQAKRGDEPAATAALLTAIGLDPSLAEGWGTLAELSLKGGRLGMAADQAAQARALQPSVLRWRLVEARALKRDNQPERAAMLLVGLDPKERASPAALELLADCYGMLGKADQAATISEQATHNRPADPAVWYLAALWAQRANKPADARRLAGRADELGDTRARDLLARLPKP